MEKRQPSFSALKQVLSLSRARTSAWFSFRWAASACSNNCWSSFRSLTLLNRADARYRTS